MLKNFASKLQSAANTPHESALSQQSRPIYVN